jgi:hypothetical protein
MTIAMLALLRMGSDLSVGVEVGEASVVVVSGDPFLQ